jgi:hypothetical protein
VVVPAWEAKAFVVVQTELALEVLVHALGSSALHDQANELSVRSELGQRDEKGMGRLLLTVPPLDEKPERFLLALGDTSGYDATQGETCGQSLSGALAPGAASKAPSFWRLRAKSETLTSRSAPTRYAQ